MMDLVGIWLPTSVGMFEMVPGFVIMAIPVSEVHLIDVGTSLGNDN
jgi:hypothetical protein